MKNTEYLPATQKKLIILYRALKFYTHSSVQDTVRFLVPRFPLSDLVNMREEWKEALAWWELGTTNEEKQRLNLEYKFAAKLP